MNLSFITYKQVEKVFKVKHVVMCEVRINQAPSDLRYGMQARIAITSSIIPGGDLKPIKIKKENLNFDGIFKP